jgi:hypothetical protein
VISLYEFAIKRSGKMAKHKKRIDDLVGVEYNRIDTMGCINSVQLFPMP